MANPCFFLVLVFVIGLADGDKDFAELRCGRHGPAIRHPFRLNTQPVHCGLPGFNLSCTHNQDTVLELPNSMKFMVDAIDYKAKVLTVRYSEPCLQGQLRRFNLSTSPFQIAERYTDDYILFNCSSSEETQFEISCLRSPSHQVRAFRADSDISEYPIASCRKMYALSSIPIGVMSGYDKSLQLNWSVTEGCRGCQLKGEEIRSQNASNGSKSECFSRAKPKDKLWKLKITGIILGSLMLVSTILALYCVYSHDKTKRETENTIKIFLEDYKNFKPTRFSYVDIKRITNHFLEKLGEGAYGTVFKGKLSNEIQVAVKILNISMENGEEFINEVGTMGRIHHVNVVRLLGFCADGFRRALVYEFLPNYSLEKFISSSKTKNHLLGWQKFQDITIGITKGIDYLHHGCGQQILHFDIKPHNILLDEKFNPKISDFGLAKLCSKDQSAVSMTTARGTIGYIAPEVFSRNFESVSYKADIYSFGILLLEVVGGRKNFDISTENTSQVYFPEWIYNFLEQQEDLRVFIEDDGEAEIANKLAIVGLWCIQWNPIDRPSMKVVIQMLEGGQKLSMPPNPFASTSPAHMNAQRIARHQNQKLDAKVE